MLDTAAGIPASGIEVKLVRAGDPGQILGSGTTDADGRIPALGVELRPGALRLTFDTAKYLTAAHGVAFYPSIVIEVNLDGTRDHYHVPVLLSAYSYTTYLGS